MLDFKNIDKYCTRDIIINKLRMDSKPVLIFGSGRFAVAAAEMCDEATIRIEGFIESDRYWKPGNYRTVNGRKIKCYSQNEIGGAEYNILCGVIDYGIMEQLRKDYSECAIVEYLDAYKPHIMQLQFLKNHQEILTELYNILMDEESKKVLEAYLHARYTGDVRCLAALNHNTEFGYDWELLKISEKDVLIDAGAYIGDSIHEVKRLYKYLPQDIFAFEPDTTNMLELIGSFTPEDMKRVHPILAGLFNSDKELHFNSSGTIGSSLCKDGETIVRVEAIDAHEAYRDVSVIKMDIEGSELDALKGAYNLLKRNKPRLAICIYHKNEDIIDIYNYLKQFDYKFYLRQHSLSNEETVLYAI